MISKPRISYDRWRRIDDCFHEALRLGGNARKDYLRELRLSDELLVAQIERLLINHEIRDGFLEPIWSDQGPTNELLLGKPGDRVGGFELIEPIALGGMAAVWLGRRAKGGFEQRVAVKLINLGFRQSSRLKRFEQERQTLAQLEHPYITSLIDGGMTDECIPFLVMEYVEGEPIDAYCDRHKLSISERLSLFQRVCEAVQYAHQNLIVHQDIKPANILVTSSGHPKLLDFGIVKLLDEAWEDAARPVTTTLDRAFTPRYASPEQVKEERITTASDSYSLGVVLYESLTGRGPYGDCGHSQFDQQKAICELDPPPPSSIVHSESGIMQNRSSDQTSTAKNAALVRACSPKQLAKQLQGDLDRIVLKAIHKERDLRYASVQQLGEDIECFLAGKPVSAQPDSLLYSARKFVQRNKVILTACTAVVLTLLIGITATAMGIARATRAEQAAASAAMETATVAGFFESILVSADPFARTFRGKDYTVRELLDAASVGLEAQFVGAPNILADVNLIVGKTYRSLALYDQAKLHLSDAIERNAEIGGDSVRTAVSRRELGTLLLMAGDAAEAETIIRKSLAVIRAADPRVPEVLAETLEQLAEVLRMGGRFGEAETLLAESLKIRQQELEGLGAADSINNMGMLLAESNDCIRAESFLRRALKMRKTVYGSNHPLVADTASLLGYVLGEQAKYNEAEPLLTTALDLKRKALGPYHPSVGDTMNLLALMHFRRGQLGEAERIYRELIEIDENSMKADHPFAAATLGNLARVLRNQNRTGEAVPLLERAIQILESRFGDDHPNIATSLNTIGAIKIGEGRIMEAEPYIRRACDMRLRLFGEEHIHTLECQVDLSRWLRAANQLKEAIIIENHAINICNKKLPDSARVLAKLKALKGLTLSDLKRYDEAEAVLMNAQKEAEQMIDESHYSMKAIATALANVRAARKKSDPASGETILP